MQFSLEPGEEGVVSFANSDASILLVDPRGNLVINYQADTEPSDIKKNLKRIL